MKDKSAIKPIKVIIIIIAVIYGISLSIIYGFWGSVLKLHSWENIKIYSTVCKNIDIKNQKLVSFNVSSESINIQLKKPYFGIANFFLYSIFYVIDRDPLSDFNSMLEMYGDLSAYNKQVCITAGAVGSSNSTYVLNNGELRIKAWLKSDTFDEAIRAVMQRNDIVKLSVAPDNDISFDSIEGQLPENQSIKHLFAYTNCTDIPNIKSFKGLNTLELMIFAYVDNDDPYFNMDFLNDMPQLETLILHWFPDRFDFSDTTRYVNVKKVILYIDEHSEEDETLFHDVFPNAEIEIKDYSNYFKYWAY